MDKKNYTIKDIATMAEVSRGTVDRVLNKRGKVSEKAKRKVEAVLKSIDYRPNLIARSLKNHRTYKICLLMPDDKNDLYWQQMHQGVMDAYDEFKSFGMAIELVPMGNSVAEYYRSFNSVLDNKPDALVIVPFYTDACTDLYRRLEKMEVPFILLNSSIRNVDYNCFIGQNYFKSGRSAAYLMDILTNQTRKERRLLIVHIDVQKENQTHLEEKEKGFLNYFSENDSMSTIEIIQFDEKFNPELLDNKISEVDGLYVTNSRTYVMAEIIRKYPSVKIIGYDMIPENIDLLEDGIIDVLLNQNPKQQGYHGIAILADYLLYQREMPKKKLLPVDILTRENISGYL